MPCVVSRILNECMSCIDQGKAHDVNTKCTGVCPSMETRGNKPN